jgi:hypothetical protein
MSAIEGKADIRHWCGSEAPPQNRAMVVAARTTRKADYVEKRDTRAAEFGLNQILSLHVDHFQGRKPEPLRC